MSLGFPPSYSLFGNSPERGLSTSFHVERISHRYESHRGTVEPHKHPHLHQLTYWVAGEGRYILEGGQVPIVPGMICWNPAGRIHGFSVGPQGDAIVLSMTREYVDKHLASIERHRGAQVLLQQCIVPPVAERITETAALFADAEHHYAAAQWGWQEAIGAIASLAFIRIGRFLTEHGRLESGAILKTPLFGRLHECVEECFRDHPTVEELAHRLGTTPYLLNQSCRSATGENVSAFVRRRILREAERQLLFSDSSIAAISDFTGFADPSHFSRLFRAHHGVTPRAWRTRVLKREDGFGLR
jgi:AraC family transcriptional regulator, transcriptional activator of pobA